MTSQTIATAFTPEELSEIKRLKSWQIILAVSFVFLLLPSLATPPSLLTLSAILCSVFVYRSWLARITARRLTANIGSMSKNKAYWSSLWTLTWRSFAICVLLLSLTLIVIAPDPMRAGAGVGVLLLAWLASLLFSLDVPIWIFRGLNPTAVLAGICGVLSLILGMAPILGQITAISAVFAGLAARREFASTPSPKKGQKLALVGLILGTVVLVVSLALLGFSAIAG